MSARAMASGTISFGLVAIPVKLYSTNDRSSSISFSWIHPECGGRVKQQYYCPQCDEVVSRKDLQKGYEFAKGQYVLFSDDELSSVTVKSTHSIDISEFVPVEEVDPIYFDRTYYLGPDKGGDRPYRLLARVMRETERVGIARYAARGKSYLVLLRPYEEGVVMQQLRYVEDIKDFSEVPVGEVEVDEQELDLATRLVDQIASDSFDAEEYEDEARKTLWTMIERKIEGKEITAEPTEEPKAQIVDLMEALKASIATEEGEKAARRPAKRSARSGTAAEGSGKKGPTKGNKKGSEKAADGG